MKKNKFWVLSLTLFLAFWCSTIFAQTTVPSDRPLEVTYPSFPQVTPPTTVSTPVTEYVRYIYYFFLFASGFFALGSFFYGSFRYITSAGRPDAMKDAKDQILAAVFGVAILFSSWIILNQINPNLTTFTLNPARPFVPSLTPGVLLCKQQVGVTQAWTAIKDSQTLNKEFDTASASRQKEIITELSQKASIVSDAIASTTKFCWQASSAGDIPDPFNDKVEWAYLIPSASSTAASSSEYGAILYENTKFGGKSLAIYGSGSAGQTSLSPNPEPSEWAGIQGGKTIKELHPSSVKPFVLNYQPKARPVWFADLYELVDYNKADSAKKKVEVTLPSSGQAAKSSTVDSGQKLGSLQIEGSLFVVFFKEKTTSSGNSWQGEIDVFTESDTNLYDNLMGRWCSKDGELGKEYWPCAPGGLVVISGSVQGE